MSESPFIEPPARHVPDALPIRETSLALLDLERVQSHITEAFRRGRYDGPTEVIEYLQTHHCIATIDGNTYLTLTGLLCFGKNPQGLFPHAVIDLGHYSGREAVSQAVIHLEKSIGGTIFEQLARVEDYLWKNTHHGMTLSLNSLQRVEVHEYPRAVIRELGVNMVAHRDYSIYGSAARVQLFRNRIEWVSPGGLPPGLTVENLLYEQRPRNPHMLRVLYEAGYVEAFGQGLDTVVAVLRDERMVPPEFCDTGASFIATVYGRIRDTQNEEEPELRKLSDPQVMILTVLRARGELAPRELRTYLAGRGERSLQRDLRKLLDAGLIEPVGETRSLKYRVR